jgi:hypothetical protein
MFAVTAPRPLGVVIGMALVALIARGHGGAPPPPAFDIPPAPEPVAVRSSSTCDFEAPTTVVIRGSLRSRTHADNHFSIAFSGKRLTYAAITDAHGYFEVRIPRDDLADPLCGLPASGVFDDDDVALRYHFGLE